MVLGILKSSSSVSLYNKKDILRQSDEEYLFLFEIRSVYTKKGKIFVETLHRQEGIFLV